MEAKEKVFYLIIVAVVVALILIAVSQLITKTTGYSIKEPEISELAQCLSSKGAVMYGLDTCSHCKDQKAMFGLSFQYIDYKPCEKDILGCNKLQGVPAWIINNQTYYGTQDLEKLKELSGC